MRASHEYYNTLVRSTRPIFAKFNEAMDGDAQRSLRNYESRISDEYAAIREINQKNRKRIESPEVMQHLENIKKLKVERNPLYEAARKERRENMKPVPSAGRRSRSPRSHPRCSGSARPAGATSRRPPARPGGPRRGNGRRTSCCGPPRSR